MTPHEQEKQLSRLLKQWPDLEPRPAFAPDVLRRIRLEAARPSAPGLWAWLPAWLRLPGRLAWAAGVPLALALAIGVASAWVLPAPDTRPALPFGGFSVLERGKGHDRDAVTHALSGHLCRCTGRRHPCRELRIRGAPGRRRSPTRVCAGEDAAGKDPFGPDYPFRLSERGVAPGY